MSDIDLFIDILISDIVQLLIFDQIITTDTNQYRYIYTAVIFLNHILFIFLPNTIFF